MAYDKIKIKRGLKENLPILDVGELAYCTDSKELFIGDYDGNVKPITDISQSELLKEYVGSLDNLTTDEKSNIVAAMNEIDEDVKSHKAENMPHIMTDLRTGKKYRYGYQVSASGIPQIISEEVI